MRTRSFRQSVAVAVVDGVACGDRADVLLPPVPREGAPAMPPLAVMADLDESFAADIAFVDGPLLDAFCA
jgi:hypothetical protein